MIVLRFFNTVGPRQTGRYGMVLPTFVTQALTDRPITVYGTGEQTRCFGHVRDACEAVWRLLHIPAAVGHTFNIGTNEEVSIARLAEIVRDATGSDPPSNGRRTSRRTSRASRTWPPGPRSGPPRAHHRLRPRTPLTDIVADVIAYQRGHASASCQAPAKAGAVVPTLQPATP